MTDLDCRSARELLALGEEEEAADHLRGCVACRLEAQGLHRVVSALEGVDLSAEPPEELDAAVRSLLAVEPLPRATLLRPFPALALASAGLVALVVSLSSFLGAAGVGDRSVALAPGLTIAYFALCAAVTTPLLVHGVPPFRRDAAEVDR